MSFSGMFAIGVSGVNAFAQSLEAVSSNIANSQTDGYKRVRTDFSSLIPTDAPELSQTIGDASVGNGVVAQSRQLVNEQGAVTRTNVDTNIAIGGGGLFVVADTAGPNDDFLFTRAGGFTANGNGDLVNAGGYFLQGVAVSAAGSAAISGNLSGLETINVNTVPAGAAAPLGAIREIDISEDGFVTARYASGEEFSLFQIPLALFRNVDGLEEAEASAWRNSEISGEARLAIPGEGAAGRIENEAIELSTVDIGQEFSTLIAVQRAYASNARLISVADELLQTLVSTAA